MKYEQWFMCPVCGSKTRLKLREDIILDFPVIPFCPLAPLGIHGIIDRENDPGGPHHAGKSQPAAANRRL